MKGKLTNKVKGTKERPRLAVHRSLNHIYAQLIDDDAGKTLAYASTLMIKKGGATAGKQAKKSNKNVEAAKRVGAEIAKKAIEAGIKKVVFDRGGQLYHGRISALADAARAGGLEF